MARVIGGNIGGVSIALRKALNLTKAESRKLSLSAAKIGESHMRSVAPIGKRSHSRKSGKGAQQKTFNYMPGNLKRSMRTHRFRKSWFVHVGPKINKPGGAPDGSYSSARRADGYYGRWVKAGTRVRKTRAGANRGAISKGRNDFIGKTIAGRGAQISQELVTSFKNALRQKIKANSLTRQIVYKIRFRL